MASQNITFTTDVQTVLRTWKMEVSGHRKIGRLKLRWTAVILKRMDEGERSTERRSTRHENVEN